MKLLFYFVLAFFIVFMLLYFLNPDQIIVRIYPDPTQNISKMYVDDNGTCYKYHRYSVSCDK